MEKNSFNNSAPTMVKMEEIQGRGRALVATQALKPGQIILKDSPLLLYSASPLIPSNQHSKFCSNCFRLILQTPVPCPWCSSSVFCSSSCQSIALSSSHTPWVCQALNRLREGSSSHKLVLDQELQTRFLISAYNLAVTSPSDFRILLSLQGDSSSISEIDAMYIHSIVSSVCPPQNLGEFGFSKELSGALLAKDKVNAFGLMEPFAPDKERGVRAYGIYPKASFFNHDCLPNACRFDYVDSEVDKQGNTDIIVRVIHDVPMGREICLSYFPVNLKYSERQQRLKEDYGFTCNCDRCAVEANWSDDEEDDAMDNEGQNNEEDEEDEAMEEDVDDEVNFNDVEHEEKNDDFPHAYFFVRYVCTRENCFGTLAPLPPSEASRDASTVMECNMCGNLSKCDELMVGAGH